MGRVEKTVGNCRFLPPQVGKDGKIFTKELSRPSVRFFGLNSSSVAKLKDSYCAMGLPLAYGASYTETPGKFMVDKGQPNN
jgi:hypothetical protein